MAANLTYVRFQYSTDSGTTWLPAGTGGDPHKDVRCLVTVTVPTEVALEQTFEEAARIRRVMWGRITVQIAPAGDTLGEQHDTNDALLAWLEVWLRYPLLRIFTHGGPAGAASPTGANADGKSYFATASNTYYVVPADGAEPEIRGSRSKAFPITLEVAAALT